ncbi:thermonuclease family protein [uncultured Tateyamaria sp.]|uniref:thermonuclease family protein n=1 Tax=uncultured Tateyamaria sp. TaxID=455651 RepID=UPI00260F4BAF|nr:thermonuclease family protein [uncultured Tateyamaria sp.]
MPGTSFTAKVDRVVDGDTVRVFLNDGDDKSESLRILSLDTEEVNAGTKPVTPLGHAASDRAKELITPGDTVTVILPGNEDRDDAIAKYRGNFGRLLCYLQLEDGTDFQELMIREGLSPYFQKYGYAQFSTLHTRYAAAERAAQAHKLGIWDQIANNGSVLRDYAALGTWWDLRARIIEGYREIKRRAPEVNLFNTRLDYDRLVEIAKARGETTVFMELRDFSPVSGDHVVFRTGSLAQPYQLFIPNGNSDQAQDIMNLILTRYRPDGEGTPRRSYAYVTGPTKMFPDNDTGRPEIVVTDPDQITDWPASALERSGLITA